MKPFIFFALFVYSSFSFSQKMELKDCLGVYKGKLSIYYNDKIQNLDMEFHLLATDQVDVYDYKLIYVESGVKQERSYLLKKKLEVNKYTVDEKNGILLEAFFTNNTLHSIFEVEGNLLTTTESFTTDYMDFYLMSSAKSGIVKSGGANNIPEVFSYPVNAVQSARLYKQK
jgi:hypothetical protein